MRSTRLDCGLGLTLRGLTPQDAAIWIDIVRSGWRNHPKAVPMQVIGLLQMGWLISQSTLTMRQWLPCYACMVAVSACVIPLAMRFRGVTLHAGNYRRWRALLVGWRAMQAVSGGLLCGLLYSALAPPWQLTVLITVVVFTYGMAFFAIEDVGLALVGTAPIVLLMLVALLATGRVMDRYIAVLLAAASINGWLACRAISQRLFEAGRIRQRNAALMDELACEVRAVNHAKAEAEEANRSKSSFFAAASHDMRQPLYSAQLLSDHLRRRLKDSEQLDVANKLASALNAMRHLFERLFDVARLEAQKVSVQPQPINIRDLFVSLDHEFALACSEKGLRWQVAATDDWIFADPILVQRMLRNLLENALRYTPQGGVTLRARRRGAQVHCQVWDTGVGIQRRDRHKVFDDYFQVENLARQAKEGLGLGLGMVRRLAVLTGAGLALRSRPGRGSCFGVRFEAVPAVPAQTAPAALMPDEADPPSAAWRPHECALVIEDHAEVRHAVSLVLRDSGYAAIAASTASEALTLAAQRDMWPRLVICDFRLGASGDGLHAIAWLRHELGAHLSAMLVTGDITPELADKARVLGIQLLHKPVDRSEFLQAIAASTT
jgi:signal transduction histidine kinase/CheY-like chemotaxis protein